MSGLGMYVRTVAHMLIEVRTIRFQEHLNQHIECLFVASGWWH